MTLKSHAAEQGSPDAVPSRLRFGPPPAEELSRQDWVGRRAAAVLPDLAAQIDTHCASFGPLILFLGGSAVHGELCGIQEAPSRRTILSDLDLGVVTKSRVPLEAKERLAAELAAAPGDRPAARVGFYHRDVLGRQDPTVGLVETVRCGFVLDGDASYLSRFGMPAPARIPPWEAVRLLANRVIEWAASLGEASPARDRVYAAAKLHADAATVYLVARGGYRGGGYAARAAALGSLGLDEEVRGRIEDWTSWRLEPTWERTPLGPDVPSAAASPALAEGVTGTVRDLLRSLTGGEAAGRLLLSSPVRGVAWARSWRRWVGLFPASLRRLRPADWKRTPRGLLWEAAVEWVLGRPPRATDLLARLTGVGPDDSEQIHGQIVGLAQMMNRHVVD